MMQREDEIPALHFTKRPLWLLIPDFVAAYFFATFHTLSPRPVLIFRK